MSTSATYSNDAESSRLIRIFDVGLFSFIRQGKTNIKSLFVHSGHLLVKQCQLGTLCIARTNGCYIDSVDAKPAQDTRQIIEILFHEPRSGTIEITLGQAFMPAFTDAKLIKACVPMFIGGKRVAELAEWWFFLQPHSDRGLRPVEEILLHHAVDTLGHLMGSILELNAYNIADRVLRAPSFIKRAADNYLAYSLIRNASQIFGGKIKSASFWRISRTDGLMQMLAKKPGGVIEPRLGINANAVAFLNAFGEKGTSYLRCIVVDSSPHPNEGIRRQVSLLNSLAIQHSIGKFLDATSYPIDISDNFRGSTMNAAYYCNSSVIENRRELLEQSLHELCGDFSLAAGEIIALISFGFASEDERQDGAEDDTKEMSSDDKSEPYEKIPEFIDSQPSKMHKIPFCGTLLLKMDRVELSSLLIHQVALCLNVVSHSLDGFSRQRLQFGIFAKGLDKLERAKSINEAYAACEFVAKELFDCAGIVEWSNNPLHLRPLYKSDTFSRVELERMENDPGFSEITADSFTFTGLMLNRSWLNALISDQLPLDQSFKTKEDSLKGISGFVLPVPSKETTFFFIRLLPSRSRSIDITFAKAFSSIMARVFGQLLSSKRLNAPVQSIISLASVRNLSQQDAEKIALSPLEEIETLQGVKGHLLFHCDKDANVLTLIRGRHEDVPAINRGRMIYIDDSTFAGACAISNSALLGKKVGGEIQYTLFDGENRASKRVKYLGWLPDAELLYALPVTVEKQLHYVVVISCDPALSKLKLRKLSHILQESFQKIKIKIEDMRAIRRIELHDDSSDVYQPLLLLPPPQPFQPHLTSNDLPNELTALYSPEFRKAVNNLLQEYLNAFHWRSISLRVADWYGQKLYRIAYAGVRGTSAVYFADDPAGVVPYSFRYGQKNRVISLPQILDGRLDVLETRYPGLKFRSARPGTQSEVCVALLGADKLPIGTLNVESAELNAFSNTKWACVRIADMIQHALNFRATVYQTSLESSSSNSADFLGHAYHELKSEIRPLFSNIMEKTEKYLPKIVRAELEIFMLKEKARLNDRMFYLADRGHKHLDLNATVNEVFYKIVDLNQNLLSKAKIETSLWTDKSTALAFIHDFLFRHSISTLLSDTIQFCHDSKSDEPSVNNIVVIAGIFRPGIWSIHVGHDGRPLDAKLASDLFWVPVQSSNSSGRGLAYLGLIFQMLRLYPRASENLPDELPSGLMRKFGNYHTWFNISAKIASSNPT